MRPTRIVVCLFMLGLLGAGECALAANAPAAAPTDEAAMASDVHRIAEDWAHIKYQVRDKDAQLQQIDALSKQAAAVAQRYPGRAEPLLWQGIVTSEEASMAHLLDRLGYAKAARRLFEQAAAIDPDADHGGIQLSLGVIYYRVPGFPVGFGSDAKARKYLERAVALDPDGLDTAYFYGDFLIKEHQYARARQVLMHGLAAPMNTERPIWDQGRREEIKGLIARLDRLDPTPPAD